MRDVCGIYMIENLVNGKIYIGQTTTIQKRFNQHKLKLNNGSHINKHLQSAWNIYGANAFDFKIVEECDESSLDEREMYWIEHYNTMKNGYNQTLGGGGKRGWVAPEHVVMKRTGKNSATAKKVVCLNTGDTFDCIRDAAKSYGVHYSLITMCCQKKIKSCGSGNGHKSGNVWVYYDDYVKLSQEDINKIIEESQKRFYGRPTIQKRVICLSTGEIFDSTGIAAKAYGIQRSGVSMCCNGKHKTCGGFEWSYYDGKEAG